MTNWNVVRIVYGSGFTNVELENRNRTCLLHWSTSLHKHIQKLHMLVLAYLPSQGSIPIATYYFVQTIQRFKEYGPSRGPLPCNMVLVVVVWSCQRRSSISLRPLASFLAFPVPSTGRLHGHGE